MAIHTDYNSYISNLFSGNYGGYAVNNRINTQSAKNSSGAAYVNNTTDDPFSAIIELQRAEKNKLNIADVLSENVRNFLMSAKSSSSDLLSLINTILDSNENASFSLDEKSAVSSNNNVLEVNSMDSNKSSGILTANIQVDSIAAKQKNIGYALDSKELAVSKTGLTQGTHSFTLDIENRSYTIGVTISNKDTNQSAQQKIANAINSKNMGVNASVIYDSKEGTTALILESEDTGTDIEGEDKFTISDFSGNIVEKFGIGVVTQQAQNAKYRVNGGIQITSENNEVNIGSGISVNLKSTGRADVTISRNTALQIGDIKGMITSFNGLLKATKDNKEDWRTSSLHTQMNNLSKSYASSLSRVGIDVTKDGYLKINESKLDKAVENGSLERFLAENNGVNYGFSNKLSSLVENVSNNPVNYSASALIESNSMRYDSSGYYGNMNAAILFDKLF